MLASREGSIILLLLILVIVFGAINQSFLALENIQSILRSTAYIGIVSVGMALCLISGTIDLSIGAVAGLSGVIMAHFIIKEGWPWYIGLGLGVSTGVLFGIANWLLTIKAKVVAFIATIGTMYLAKGLSTVISNAYSVYPLPSWMGEIASASPMGVSVAFLIFVGLVIIFEVAIRNSLWGLKVRATGSDREVAICTEVDVDNVSLSVSIMAGVLTSISGMLLAWKLISAQPAAGTGWELSAITACAIGGVSLFGYEGSFVGVFLGVLAMQTIMNGMVVIGLSPYLQQGVTGVILLVSMAIDMYRREKMVLLEKVKNEY